MGQRWRHLSARPRLQRLPLFAEIEERGGFFVTRLYSNALYRLLESLPIEANAAQYGVIADSLIELGSGQERLRLRRVVYRDAAGEEYEYMTNRFDLDVLDVVRLYLYRWEIEIFSNGLSVI
jgi:hypothetical protein